MYLHFLLFLWTNWATTVQGDQRVQDNKKNKNEESYILKSWTYLPSCLLKIPFK